AVQLLARELAPGSRFGEYTQVLIQEVDRVNRIIEQLLDLARPVQLRTAPLNLHQLLERVALLAAEGAQAQGVTIVRRYDPSLPPILGDEDRLVQVFHNLVRNAFDAMKGGGRLTLRPRILVADDEDGVRWVLEKGLREAGYEVTSVKDGESALRHAEADVPDLIFLDVRMPGLDGLAVLGRLRAGRPDALVIVMTAHGTMETAIQAMQRGAYDYLAKPFDLDEVLLLAERALTARRLTQEVAELRTGLQ